MEGAVRLLRGGRREQQAAPIVAILDSAESFSGGRMAAEIAQRLQEACTSGRATAGRVICATDGSLCGTSSDVTAVLEYSADPFSWHRSLNPEVELPADIQAQLASSSNKALLIITCLGLLLTTFTHSQVLSALSDLSWRPEVQGMLLLLHQDIVDPAFVTAVSAMAACTMQLQPLGASSILLRTCMKKRSGLATATTEALHGSFDGRITTGAPSSAGAGGLASKAGIALLGTPQTVNTQESLAKQGVVLPHERAAQDSVASTPSTNQKLGAIYYERDSEDEYDSDVDPDDDLDI